MHQPLLWFRNKLISNVQKIADQQKDNFQVIRGLIIFQVEKDEDNVLGGI